MSVEHFRQLATHDRESARLSLRCQHTDAKSFWHHHRPKVRPKQSFWELSACSNCPGIREKGQKKKSLTVQVRSTWGKKILATLSSPPPKRPWLLSFSPKSVRLHLPLSSQNCRSPFVPHRAPSAGAEASAIDGLIPATIVPHSLLLGRLPPKSPLSLLDAPGPWRRRWYSQAVSWQDCLSSSYQITPSLSKTKLLDLHYMSV